PSSSAAPVPAQLSTLSLHDALPISRLRSHSHCHRLSLSPASPGLPRPQWRNAKNKSCPHRRLPLPPRNRAAQRCRGRNARCPPRSEEHTSELQSRENLVCRLLLEKK